MRQLLMCFLRQPAGAKKKPQLSAWQCFWHIAHYGGRGSVSRGCAPPPNQTSTDIREGTKIYNADSTPVSPLSRISAQDCENFSPIPQRELKQRGFSNCALKFSKQGKEIERNSELQWSLCHSRVELLIQTRFCFQVF